MGIRHILTQHEPVKGGLSPVRVVLIYVVYPLCRKLFSCIFLIPVKIPVKSNSGKIPSKVSGTVHVKFAQVVTDMRQGSLWPCSPFKVCSLAVY